MCNMDLLRELYRTNEVARLVLDHFAGRTKRWRNLNAVQLEKNLAVAGRTVTAREIVAVLRSLEQAQCGVVVPGDPVRFAFGAGESLVEIGRGAASAVGPQYGKEAMESNGVAASHTTRTVVHLQIPADLTEDEADRLAAAIKALAAVSRSAGIAARV